MRYGYSGMKCCLLGEHLSHSFSPLIHNELADYSYELMEISPDELKDFVERKDFDALNVTIPYKQKIMPLLDFISEESRKIGAVNTVVKRDGKLYGYNTDYFGLEYLFEISSISPSNKKVLVLGSGGASATARALLEDKGAREIVTISRSGENNYENISLHHDADIIVNTTPVGMYPNACGLSPIELSDFKNCSGVIDVIYNPSKTKLLLDAEKRSLPYANGLPMLVAQAVKAFEFFTGEKAPKGEIEKITKLIERKTKNLILIGMPSSGKSTVGKIIAEKMGRKFFDADLVFEKEFGISPSEAINTLGEEKFREMETEVAKHLGCLSSAVISMGGGVVTKERNYDLLHQNGVILLILRDISLLSSLGRPLSEKRSPEVLWNERKDAYEYFSDISLESSEIPEITAENAVNLFNSFLS